MKVKLSLSEPQAYALRRLDGMPGTAGVAAQTWRALERLLLVRREEDEDGVRWALTASGRDVARRLRNGEGTWTSS